MDGEETTGAEGVAGTHGGYDFFFGRAEAGSAAAAAVFGGHHAAFGEVDHDHLPDALVQKRAGSIFHIFEIDGAVGAAEGYAQALLGLDLVDNEVVGIFEARQHDFLVAIALFGNDVHAGFVALLAKAIQGARGCHAVLGILFVKAVQQQQVTQVEDFVLMKDIILQRFKI